MKIRNGMKGTFAKVFMLLLAVTVLGGYGITKMLMKAFGRSVDGIASINGVEIPTSMFQHAVYEEEQKIHAARQKYGAKADLYMQLMGMSTDPKATALKQLVAEEIIRQYGDSLSIALNDQYIQEKLANPHFIMQYVGHILPPSVFTQDGRINVYALTQFMATPEMNAVKVQLAEKLRSQFALLMTQSAVYIPNFMSKDIYNGHHVAKRFSVQKFDIHHFKHLVQQEGVTKDALRNFYEQKANVDKWYWIPEQRFGAVWEFLPADYGIQVSDSEIQEYYSKNKTTRYIEQPAQFKVREIIFSKASEMGMEGLRQEAEKAYARVLSNPESFADVAKEVSQNKETAAKGGLVDYFVRGSKDKEYEKAMVRLKNDGEITGIVKTAEGFAIVQRVGRKEPIYSSLESVKKAIVTSLTEQKFRRTFAKDADRVVKERNEADLNTFISSHHGSKKNVGPIEKNKGSDYQRIFGLRNDGDSAVFIQDGKGMILTLQEKKARHLPAFSSMIEKITHDYEEDRAYLLLQDAMKKAQDMARNEGMLVTVDGSKIHTTDFISPENTEEVKKMVDQEEYPNDFIFMTFPGQMMSASTKKGGILIRVDELKKEDASLYSEKKLTAEGESYKTIHNLFTSACLASLFRTATIRINEELIHGKDNLL